MATKGASYDELATAVRRGNIAPIYLLYGDERWFVDRLQALIVAQTLAPAERDFNLDTVYGRESDIQTVISLCSSFPMMAERRVVIVRDFDQIAENKLFVSFAEQPNQAAVVILTATKVNLSHHPYRAIGKHGVVADFKRLYDRDMPRRLTALVREAGLEIDERAVGMLAEYVGTNLQVGEQEVDKLRAFIGDRVRITEDDIVQASGHTREFNVFELQKEIGSGHYAASMRIAERLLQQASSSRGEALKIVSILSSFFTKMWILSSRQEHRMTENEMAKRIGVSPYFIRDYLTSLRRFDSSSLASAFSALLAADYELKGGSKRDERLVLGLLFRRLTGPAAHGLRAA